MSSSEPRANVLLVDDRPENLLALEAILEPLQQNLLYAHSGEEALRELLHRDIAVILLDVQMPGIDGFETAALIKQREKTRAIPIIFLTAISKEEQHVFRGYSAGAVDYLFKPFNPDVLRSKVMVFIELHQKTRQLQRQAELLRERELAELRRESEERYRFMAEAQPDQIWTAVPDGQLDYVNQRVLDYFARTFDEMVGSAWTGVVHPDDLPRSLARWQAAIDSGAPYETEFRLRRAADGAFRWHLARALAMRDRGGKIVKWFGSNTDIDDQKRAEEAQRFLVEAGAVLGSSLDLERTLGAVAELAVPRIADWCAIELVDAHDGSIRQVAVAHVDPAKVKLAHELNERYPPSADATSGTGKVVATGKPELVAEIPDDLLAAAADGDDLHLDLLRELGLESYVCAPLLSQGEAIGAISLVAAESGRRYDSADLALAEELARRTVTAIENARLYREVEERAQAARVLATVGDGVVLVDSEGVIRLWNEAARAITGLAEANAVGRRAEHVIPGWESLVPRVPVASAPGPAAVETVPLELDGRELWLSISGVGFEEGTVYAFRDLTEERMLEAMRQDLVATVSHELRTPLAAIYGSAVTLRRADIELDEQLRSKLLEIIAEESGRLADIINDLLLASQLDSGKLDVKIDRFDARELTASVVDAARTHLPEGVTLELEQPRKKIPAVAADEGQLRQVLGNLIDNAIKYSPEGGPVLVRLEPGERRLRFAIADQGLGIPQGERLRIFEKFYRLDPDMARGIGGTGLGLYICRELVRRVNGKIWVEPGNGSGSVFYVELPFATEPAKSRRPRKASSAA